MRAFPPARGLCNRKGGRQVMPAHEPWPISRALGRIVVSPQGALDDAAAASLRIILRDLIEDQGNLEVVIDALQVTAIGDAAIDVLVEASRHMDEQHGTLVISAAREEVLARLDDHDLLASPPRHEPTEPLATAEVIDLRRRAATNEPASQHASDPTLKAEPSDR
jgi:anti-anti-sigma factor